MGKWDEYKTQPSTPNDVTDKWSQYSQPKQADFGEIRRGDAIGKTERRISERESLLPAVAEELQFDPLSQENIQQKGFMKAGIESALKPAVLGLKGLGAGLQYAESVESTPFIELTKRPELMRQLQNPLQIATEMGEKIAQKKSPIPVIKEVGQQLVDMANVQKDSVVGKRVTEFGDAFRMAGAPEAIAAPLGMFMAFNSAGTGSILRASDKVTSKLTQTGFRAVGKGKDKVVNMMRPMLKKVSQAGNSAKRTFSDFMASSSGIPSKYVDNLLDNYDRVFDKKMRNRDEGVLLREGRKLKDKLFKKRTNLGTKVAEAKAPLLKNATKQVNMEDSIDMFNNVLRKYDMIDPATNTIRPAMLTSTDPYMRKVITLHGDMMRAARKNATFRQADEMLSALDDLVKYDPTGKTRFLETDEAIIKQVRNGLRKQMGDVGGDDYNNATRAYSEFSNNIDGLNRFGLSDEKNLEKFYTLLGDSGNSFFDELTDFAFNNIPEGEMLRQKALDVNTAQAFLNRKFKGLRQGIVSKLIQQAPGVAKAGRGVTAGVGKGFRGARTAAEATAPLMMKGFMQNKAKE